MSEVSDHTLGQLQLLASGLKNNHNYMAVVLASYQKIERLSDAGLMQLLGASPLSFARIAISKRPTPDSPDFAQEVKQIANYAGSDPATLANIIRQVDSLEAYRALHERESGIPASIQLNRIQTGLLAAARDQIDQEPEAGEDSPAPENDNQEGGNELADE